STRCRSLAPFRTGPPCRLLMGAPLWHGPAATAATPPGTLRSTVVLGERARRDSHDAERRRWRRARRLPTPDTAGPREGLGERDGSSPAPQPGPHIRADHDPQFMIEACGSP